MQLSNLVQYIPDSTSLIIEPTKTSGALFLGNISSLMKSYKQNQIKATISICEFSEYYDIVRFINNFYFFISNQKISVELLNNLKKSKKCSKYLIQLDSHLVINIDDSENENIKQYFEETNKFIDENIKYHLILKKKNIKFIMIFKIKNR